MRFSPAAFSLLEEQSNSYAALSGFGKKATPVGEIGSVYTTLRVTDDWGVMEVTGGALLVRRDGAITEVRVPAATKIEEGSAKGDGWTLRLNEGWAVLKQDGERNQSLARKP